MGNALEILVLQALAQQALGDETGAMERNSQALSLAEPEGYIRLFVDEGAPMAHLLVQMRARKVRVISQAPYAIENNSWDCWAERMTRTCRTRLSLYLGLECTRSANR